MKWHHFNVPPSVRIPVSNFFVSSDYHPCLRLLYKIRWKKNMKMLAALQWLLVKLAALKRIHVPKQKFNLKINLIVLIKCNRIIGSLCLFKMLWSNWFFVVVVLGVFFGGGALYGSYAVTSFRCHQCSLGFKALHLCSHKNLIAI